MDRIGPAPQPAPLPAPSKKEKAVAQDFAAVFLTEMVDEMMKTVKLGGLDGGQAEETWRSFLARAMADQIARSGTTGIAQSVERVLSAYGQQTGSGADAAQRTGAANDHA